MLNSFMAISPSSHAIDDAPPFPQPGQPDSTTIDRGRLWIPIGEILALVHRLLLLGALVLLVIAYFSHPLTISDTLERIDEDEMAQAGRAVSLLLMVLGRETNY